MEQPPSGRPGLAERLKISAGRDHDSTVIGLPRGGVPVAVAIGRQLRLPVATWSVRKVADPLQPELAIGAISGGHVAIWRNGQAALRRQEQALSQGWLQLQERELERRQRLFGDPSPKQLRNRHLIVVDDGIATGMTLRATQHHIGHSCGEPRGGKPTGPASRSTRNPGAGGATPIRGHVVRNV